MHKHACSPCGYLVHAHTACCPAHISMHAQSHTSTSSCIRHNQSFYQLVHVHELDHGSGFVHAHTLIQTHCPQSQALHIIQPSIQHCYHTHERVQILAGRHTVTQAQKVSMYCNTCTIACYPNITTEASTDPQTAPWMHEPFSNTVKYH